MPDPTDQSAGPDLGSALSQISGSGLGALQNLQSDEAKLESSNQDMASVPKFDPNQEQQGTPQVNRNGIMATMPMLIGLATLGGKVAGLHPKVMLNGINGMMKGSIQGNQQAYQDAKQKYDDAYQRYMDKYKQQAAIYREMQSVYKGQVNADLKALDISLRATGYQGKVDAETLKAWQWTQDHTMKLEQAAETQRHHMATEGAGGAGASGRRSALMDAMTKLGVTPPSGFRSQKMIGSWLDAMDKENPDKSPEEIMQGVKTGTLKMKAASTEITVAARKEAAIASAQEALTMPGGIWEKIDAAAKKVDFGDNKVKNDLRLSMQGKAVANKDIQKYVSMIMEGRAELSQVFARNGQTTDMARTMANETIPLAASYEELQAARQASTEGSAAVRAGNQKYMQSVTGEKPPAAPPPPIAVGSMMNGQKVVNIAISASTGERWAKLADGSVVPMPKDSSGSAPQ